MLKSIIQSEPWQRNQATSSYYHYSDSKLVSQKKKHFHTSYVLSTKKNNHTQP